MGNLGSFIGPALALLIIVRRGSKPRRVKVATLWRFPVLISILALLTLANSAAPGLLTVAMYTAGLVAGSAVGWFSAQHVELTLDSNTGTIMSKPTALGTAMTAGAFVARFAVDYVMKGGLDGDARTPAFAMHHATSIVGFTDALLLFVAARSLFGAWHMWIRTRPLIEQHKAAQLSTPGQS
jgi:hypothetical protein